MTNIIVAFSKRENAVNIRNILTRSGIRVSAVCLTGSKVLQHAEMWNQGIVICGARLQDMPYTELRGSCRTDLRYCSSPRQTDGSIPCRTGS